MYIKRMKETLGKMKNKYHYCNFLNVSRRQKCFKCHIPAKGSAISKPSLPPRLGESQEQLFSPHDGHGMGERDRGWDTAKKG